MPHINATEGIKRIMNNKKLYVSMLSRFKLDEMVAALLEAIATGDHEKIVFAAHAIKGAAGNLGLPTLQACTDDIEALAKENKDTSHLTVTLDALVDELKPMLERFIKEEA